ncbi:hypothetical protein TSOC_003714 [Tetrabaena socialis]|uniref:UBA domain-containing protein n=1 Tax=Tetrabaena socialis TaxID=47790 RepID=A0A2J8AAS8_9CHLO|nr:hypothetical protein TSOC_003714 [Tetrabaena socialis]|eukprot:PNH09636.1 hypothetical protein TSOC_003714 [Tetrabaena socialis]
MYAYPQRPGAATSTPFAPQQQQQQQQQQAYVPPPPPVAAPSHPALYSVSSGSVTTLRLKPSEDIRIEPPVRVSPALLPAASPQSGPPLDLALERQLVDGEGGEGEGAGRLDDAQAFLAKFKAGELPGESSVKQLVATGVTPAAAALGSAYARGGRGGADKAADFASKLEQLANMGFPLALAAGALAKHKGDAEAATETCLLAS